MQRERDAALFDAAQLIADLTHVLRDVLAVVVSQDSGLRFIRWHKDAVTCWEQVATAPWEG